MLRLLQGSAEPLAESTVVAIVRRIASQPSFHFLVLLAVIEEMATESKMVTTSTTTMLLLLLLLLFMVTSLAVAQLIGAECHVTDVEGRRRVDVDPMTQPRAEAVRASRQ